MPGKAYIGAELPPAVVHEVAARADVAYVHPNVEAEDVFTSAPAPAGNPTCGLDLINAPDAWSQRGINGTGVTVGVIDSGLCADHADINDRIWRNDDEIPGNGIDDDGNGYVDDLRGWNFESDTKNTSDSYGHGSHVAGTVAGDGTNGTACGVAPGARVMVLRVDLSVSSAGEQSVWEAKRCHTPSTTAPTSRRPASAGPTSGARTGRPGGWCATTRSRPGWSSPLEPRAVTWQNAPPYLDHPFPPGYTKPYVCAEGNSTISHNLCNGYLTLAGTSMATPHVAGAAALILQANPSLDHFGVKAILESSAVDLGSAGKGNVYGWCRIDCLADVDQALVGSNCCAPKTNSCGTVPTIWTAGNPRASKDSGLLVSADSLPGNSLALTIYTDQGGGNVPMLGGRLCIATILRGNPVTTSGSNGACDGVASFDMNAFAAGNLGGNPAAFLSIAGTTVHCQWWARDTANTFGALLTGGTFYTVAP